MIGKIKGIKSGGLDINGIIEEYEANGDINTGDFVKFLNEFRNPIIKSKEDLTLLDNNDPEISAVVLKENKVFISYSQSNMIYGMICLINDNEIIIQQNVQLISDYSRNPSAIALDENRVLIAYSRTTNFHMYIMICSIDNIMITLNTDILVNNSQRAMIDMCALTKLSDNKIFIAIPYGTSPDLAGIVCIIDGTSIDYGTYTKIKLLGGSYMQYSVTALDDNHIFMCYKSGNLYALVCSINDKTITIGETNSINYSSNTKGFSVVKLQTNKVFILYGYNSNCYLYGVIYTINDMTITIYSTYTQLSTKTYSAYNAINACLLSDQQILITHAFSGGDSIYVMICSINDKTITIDCDESLILPCYVGSMVNIPILKVNNNALFTAYILDSTNHKLQSSIINIPLPQVNKINNLLDNIFGIAQNQANNGQIVKVVRPNYNESEEN